MKSDIVGNENFSTRANNFKERIKRRRKLDLSEMHCWARYKYSETIPAYRVHIWDLFDEALLETKTFETFFDRIFAKLSELYVE